MAADLRYDSLMRRRLWLVFAGLLLVVAAQGQDKAGRGSVPSQNPGITTAHRSGQRIFTSQPDPVSLGFPKCCINGRFPVIPNRPFPDGLSHHHRFPVGGFVYPWFAYPAYPYSPDVVEPVDDSMEQDYGPGPTIFDRRRTSRSSLDYERNYDERLSRLERAIDRPDTRLQPDQPSAPAEDQPATVLVYRDGHSMDVKNYAIVGDTLYDFSSGPRKKVALADLDLEATRKQNDDRGVDFHVPGRVAGN